MAEQNQKAANPPKRGVMSWMTERAQAVQNQRGKTPPTPNPKGDRSAPQRKKRPSPGPKKPPSGGSSKISKPPAADPGRRRKGAAPGNQLRPNSKPDQREDET
jgi:hypothetical protein